MNSTKYDNSFGNTVKIAEKLSSLAWERIYSSLYEFHRGERATNAYESICSILGNDIVSKSTRTFRFERFKDGDFDVSDRKHSGDVI